MSFLNVLEDIIAGVWLGAYLFTTLVVSPALKSLPTSDGERIRTRSTIGRRYGQAHSCSSGSQCFCCKDLNPGRSRV